MIPWAAFRSTECDPDWRIELNEFNLHHYVERGPSQLTRGLDSSMLEQAHERQFATTQLGLVSDGFEFEHAGRISIALQTLLQHFDSHPHHESQRPNSPHTQHLTDLRRCNFSHGFDPLPPFETPAPILQPPHSPASAAQKPGRSPLAIGDLINPEPLSPRPAKRKYSGSHSSPHVDAVSIDSMFDIDNETLYQHTLDYMRAIHPHTAKMTRTHREARMRRPSPTRVGFHPHQTRRPREAQQAEKEASLLLSLSKGYARAVV